MPAEELRRARLMTKRAVEMNIPPWGTVCLCGAWQKAASGHFVAYGCPWLHSFRSGTYLGKLSNLFFKNLSPRSIFQAIEVA